MLFSIITPSLNCKDYISANIESVRKQGFGAEELEQRVIDGGSTDGTLDVLRSEAEIEWISEPDKGLADAVNKGIQRAKGDWIIWLNADDALADDGLKTFLRYVHLHPGIRIFCGNQAILRYDGTVEQVVPGWDYNLKDLLGVRTGMNQAATFVHQEVYQKAGLLDVGNRYTMDYEWLVRAMHHYKCVPIPHVLTHYRRRKGSITHAHLTKQYEDFLAIRRRYEKSYFTLGELRIRFYLYTDPLRQIGWLRKFVRVIKRLFGQEPAHPVN
ncbi:MAG TPA: glycosyltransferase family 2 protein [Verrucomicrobiae bacterium]|jgi:glycosyltransferase involved in cell wall biosynthesis|nr:glycosyltransferase family 2 protein [Verrucomicrobiae bacterium]